MSCCEPETTKQQQACCECPSVCCSPGSLTRRFVSRKEKQEWLERYREELEKEIAGVDERVQELKGGGK